MRGEFLKANVANIEASDLDRWSSVALQRDGGYTLAKELPKRYLPSDIAIEHLDRQKNPHQRTWEVLGLWFKMNGRLFEAIAIFNALYLHMIKYQIEADTRIHKGMPLVWISECFLELGWSVHAKRYIMYTLCEDAVTFGPEKRARDSGVYFRAVWQHGMSDDLVTEYTNKAYQSSKTLGPLENRFPERLLFELDDRWMTDFPANMEFGHYHINTLYVNHFVDKLGKSNGVGLEMLAQYLVAMIPGCRAYRRKTTPSTDLDVVGSFEGPVIDFRSELGRYFLCECKDWKKKAFLRWIACRASTSMCRIGRRSSCSNSGTRSVWSIRKLTRRRSR